MEKAMYSQIETYMRNCMHDSAHDREHVYRVLYFAMDIAKHEENADRDVLIAACLLHDIGRAEQYENPAIGHERVGSRKAYHFLRETGWPESKASRLGIVSRHTGSVGTIYPAVLRRRFYSTPTA